MLTRTELILVVVLQVKGDTLLPLEAANVQVENGIINQFSQIESGKPGISVAYFSMLLEEQQQVAVNVPGVGHPQTMEEVS